MVANVGNLGTEIVMNGTAYGEVGGRLLEANDMGIFRPYLDPDTGRQVVDIRTGNYERDEKTGLMFPVTEKVDARDVPGVPMANATLTKDAWEMLTTKVVYAVRHRLKLWSDLESSSNMSGFDGWTTPVLLQQNVSDPGEAREDMSGVAEGENFAPEIGLDGVPLPLTHIEFHYDKREIDISTKTNVPLRTVGIEQAGRRISERIEKRLLGTITGVTSHNYNTYGYTNHPARITKTDLTTPNGSNQSAIFNDILEMVEQMHNAGFHGPFVLYHSINYSVYFNNLFSSTEPSAGTLLSFILNIAEISRVERVDYFKSGFQMLLVQLDGTVAQAINGMPIQIIQYDSHGSLRVHFKIIGIMSQWFFPDYYDNLGLLHATTS